MDKAEIKNKNGFTKPPLRDILVITGTFSLGLTKPGCGSKFSIKDRFESVNIFQTNQCK